LVVGKRSETKHRMRLDKPERIGTRTGRVTDDRTECETECGTECGTVCGTVCGTECETEGPLGDHSTSEAPNNERSGWRSGRCVDAQCIAALTHVKLNYTCLLALISEKLSVSTTLHFKSNREVVNCQPNVLRWSIENTVQYTVK